MNWGQLNYDSRLQLLRLPVQNFVKEEYQCKKGCLKTRQPFSKKVGNQYKPEPNLILSDQKIIFMVAIFDPLAAFNTSAKQILPGRNRVAGIFITFSPVSTGTTALL